MKTRLILLITLIAGVATCATAQISPKGRFAWGADAGASIDMSGNDMSGLNFSAILGLSKQWMQFLGAGVQADIAVNNSCRSYPVFAELRTNFTNRPSLCFWDVKAGVSLNYLPDNVSQSGAFLSTGLGIHLARSSKFTSHIILSYSYRERKNTIDKATDRPYPDLHFASVKIGIQF